MLGQPVHRVVPRRIAQAGKQLVHPRFCHRNLGPIG
jgi:hypothetical protein